MKFAHLETKMCKLGRAVGQTYEGDLIYKFADGWGITSRRDILRFAEYNQRWQTPNRAVVLSEVLDINDETLISDILNNIIDLRALVVDSFFIDLLDRTIDDDGFDLSKASGEIQNLCKEISKAKGT